MTSFPVTEMGNPGHVNHTNMTKSQWLCMDTTCVFSAVLTTIVFILGVVGNGLVIWVAGFKINKSVITIWCLSMALSNFIFCCTLPFGIAYNILNEWIFGVFMCKFSYFIKFICMYSSIFIFTIISVDHCVVVKYPVWAQTMRTGKKAFIIVVLVWIISAVLSIPMAIFYDAKSRKVKGRNVKSCMDYYTSVQDRIIAVTFPLIFGFLIPLCVIITSYVIIMRKLKSSNMVKSKKPFKTMILLIVTFFICWIPYHLFSILGLKFSGLEIVKIGGHVGIKIANANSCLNPFLFAFMGKDVNVENAVEEENKYRFQDKPDIMSEES